MKNNDVTEQEDDVVIYTLTDEETGEEKQYELLSTCEMDGKTYYALVPAEEEVEEYFILRLEEDENGEVLLVSIEDDEEFDRVADFFDDQMFSDVDYDAQ